MIALERLFPTGRPAGHVVAWRGRETLRWERFRAETGGMAGHLSGCGQALLLCRDPWRFAVALFGLLAAGARVAVPPNAQPDTIARLVQGCDRVIDDDTVAGAADWDGRLEAGRPLLCFHTSGSGGDSKPVARSLRQFDAEIAALESRWGDEAAAAPTLSCVPHHHVYGLTFGLLWPLAAGRPFLTRRPDVWEEVLDALPDGAVLVASPAHLTRMGGLSPLPSTRRPRMVLSAGAPLPETAAQEARHLLGVPVTEIYGSTETGAIASRRRDSSDPPWRPLPGYRLETDTAGRAWLHAPQVVGEGRSELSDRILAEPGGGFRLLGRADRIVKIEGKRVALDEIEQMLLAQPEIAAAAALVLGDEQAVLAVVAVPTAQGWEALRRQGRFALGRALRRPHAPR